MSYNIRSQQDLLVAPVESDSYGVMRPYGDRAHVLVQSDIRTGLKDVPTAACCPNCGDAVAVYGQGVPAAIPHFDSKCDQCDVDLRAWCTVAVDAAYLQIVKPSTLTELVKQFWNSWLWSGITNSKGEPRNNEYTSKLNKKASEFGWSWEVSCPLCRRSVTDLMSDSAIAGDSLDYHHWRHEPDQGVCLCRECHDIIGMDTYDTALENRAEKSGFNSRHDLQVIRLMLREAAVTASPVGPWRVSNIVDRYNLPQSTEHVEGLIQVINTNEELCEKFVDTRLFSGIID